ncbi:spherulation-specific family 4 protein [Streptomyces sp. NPDC087440]|uniref:spherulation-specific family 4 protein n=1 Tax=Streptomyces sp. NPDC087440 TaxID=3365790 RepID=UPI00380168B6
MNILLPLYAHPAVDPEAWRLAARAAGRVRGVVLNAADGPGEQPDPAFTSAAADLRAAGVPVLGYVDLDYGARPAPEVAADVDRHVEWFGVDGWFFDRAPSERADLAACRRTVRSARRTGARTVVLNPGVHPSPGYARIADLIVTFEGHWTSYVAGFSRPRWTERHPPERFCHLVYGVPRALSPVASRTARTRGAAVCCAVDGELPNPWSALPPELLEHAS